MENINAIIEVGSKQYMVKEGERIKVEKLQYKEGEEFKIERILSYNDGEKTLIGRPYIKNVEVIAELSEQTKGKKIRGFVYRAKKRYRRRFGHRQNCSDILIKKIQVAV